MNGDRAELRLVRILTGVIAVGAALFGWLALAAITATADTVPAWWTPTAVFAVFGAPVVAAVAAPWLPLRGLRGALIAVATLYLAAAVSTLWIASLDPSVDARWVLNNTAAAAAALALAARGVLPWLVNAVIASLVVAAHGTSAGSEIVVAGLQDGLYSFMFCAVFIALAQLTVARARRVDVETGVSARHVASLAAARARAAERARVDALLHDTVLAALMLASRGGEQVDAAVRRHAAEAVRALSGDAVDELEVEVDLVTTLRERLARIEPRLRVDARPAMIGVPAEVAEALAEATAEAVRNALRHAQLGGELPAVSARVVNRVVRVRVADGGVGFDPAAVPEGRLGLRSSILGRVHALAGGQARVSTRPGRGTEIDVEWRRP